MDPQQLPTDQKPSKAYLQLSTEKSIFPSQQPKKQLLILDLNGTLVSRIKCRARARPGRGFYTRPHCEAFLNYIFKHFEVMVWSSATQQNVERMCLIFTEPLKLVWSRTNLKLNAQQFNSNVDTVKNLEIVWEHFSGEFNASNTIVVDDSMSKLVRQPYNLVHIRTFHHEEIREGYTDNELLKVMNYLDIVRSHSNVANYVRNEPFLSHKYIVPENKELDSAIQYVNRSGKFANAPCQTPQKGRKRQRGGSSDAVDVSTKEDGVDIKLEPVDDMDDNISTKPEADKVEEPPKKKSKKTKKEKPPRHLRKPRHKEQKKKAKAASNIPIRPQTEKKLKSIQESIKQRKQKEEKERQD